MLKDIPVVSYRVAYNASLLNIYSSPFFNDIYNWLDKTIPCLQSTWSLWFRLRSLEVGYICQIDEEYRSIYDTLAWFYIVSVWHIANFVWIFRWYYIQCSSCCWNRDLKMRLRTQIEITDVVLYARVPMFVCTPYKYFDILNWHLEL